MRHKLKGRKLNRTSAHRRSLLVNLSSALLQHEIIKTTLPKAKDLRPFVEKLMTSAKKDSVISRQRAFSILRNQELVNKLFTDISPRISTRNGGYVRIIKCGFRTGDKSPMAVVELVDRKVTAETAGADSGKTVKKAKSESKKPKSVKPTTKSEDSTVESETKARKKPAKKEVKE